MDCVTEENMKILIICEHFAPETGAQALQATKVADALHDAGCKVQVLCGVQSLPSEPREYSVVHVPTDTAGTPKSLFARVRRRARYEFDTVSKNSRWVREMRSKVLEITAEFSPDIVMTQSTPFRVHLIGLALPDVLRNRWVAYFSDLWPLFLAPYPYRTRLSNVLRPFQMRVLAEVLSKARGALFSNDVAIRRLLNGWPNGDLPRCDVVTHIGTPLSGEGIDLQLAKRFGSRFVHVGKITRERAVWQIVEAIHELEGEIGPTKSCSGFSFVGDVDGSFRRSCADLERRGLVEFIGEVSPQQAQTISRAARALVVIEAAMEESPFLASKFADYAMLGKPILAITAAGPVRDYLSRHGGGVAVGHDATAIAGAIRDVLGSHSQDGGNDALGSQFVAGRVAQQYLDAFRRMV